MNLSTDLPMFHSFITKECSFYSTNSLSITSIHSLILFILADVPFQKKQCRRGSSPNGRYSHGEDSFYQLRKESITHDESKTFDCFIIRITCFISGYFCMFEVRNNSLVIC